MKIVKAGRDPTSGLTVHRIDCAYRKPDGKPTHVCRIAIGPDDLARKIAEIRAITGGSVTAPRYSTCADAYHKRRGYGGMKSVHNRIKTELGRAQVDRRFPGRFETFMSALQAEGRRINTMRNYRSCVRAVLRYAYRTGILDSIPIRDFGIERPIFRERVLAPDEQLRLINTARTTGSHLYYAILFSLKNPIRKTDLFNLTRDALDLTRPWISFTPAKTSQRKRRPTYLVEIDDELREYFLNLPGACPFLFPRLTGDGWQPMGNPRRHFGWLCQRANIADFHFHDLRHCAVTYMVRAGYSDREIMELGIEYTRSMISVYCQRTAEEILAARQKFRSTFVAPAGIRAG